MTDKEIIESLKTLISESYAGNPMVARNFTIIKDCKKDSFDFVINEVISAIEEKEKLNKFIDDIYHHMQIKRIQENSFYGMLQNAKSPFDKCRKCRWGQLYDADGEHCQLDNRKNAENCNLFEGEDE